MINCELKKQSNVLITGATGFVGRELVRQISKYPNYFSRAAVRKLGSLDNFCNHEEVFIEDISAKTDWADALKNVDVVIHTAARVHVMKEEAMDPLHEFRCVNVDGTLNLARQAAEQGVKRFIFISSIKVNGEETSLNRPFKPDDSPKPEDAYAISKHEAEQGLFDLSAKTGMEIVIIRPPLVYGPGVKGNFQNMIKGLMGGFPLPLGKITNKRSFVYIGNLVSLIIRCIEHPLAANQVFLVSDGEDLSTKELLYKMSLALDKPLRLFSVPYKILNVGATLLGKKTVIQRLCGSLQVDITKTCELLDWQPAVQSDDGLKATAALYLSEINK